MMNTESNLPEETLTECVILKGELEYLGKHIMLKANGFTICGCPTVDYDKKTFKDMPPDFPSEYEIVEWDITCPRCLNMMELMEGISNAKKAQKN